MAGKFRSTKSFSGINVVVEKTSYQILGILILPPSTEISELTIVVKKKYNDTSQGYIILENRRENLKLNVASSRYLLFGFALLYFVLFCFVFFHSYFLYFFFKKLKPFSDQINSKN